jgi:hypothetical protein
MLMGFIFLGGMSNIVYANEEPIKKETTEKETQAIPNRKGSAMLQVIDKSTQTVLQGGRFILQEWSEKKKEYVEVKDLVYEEKTQYFKTDEIIYSPDNIGRFKIIEKESQVGYYGEWEQEFILTDEQNSFEYKVFNSPNEGQISIKKKNVQAGEFFKDDKFKLQEWDSVQNKYIDTKSSVLYDEELQSYNSAIFYYTSKNKGKFRIVQEAILEEEEGWIQEFQLTKHIQIFEYIIDFVEETMNESNETEAISFQKSDIGIEEIEYGIYAAEDIVLPDGTLYKSGELVQIVKVNKEGFLSIANLFPYKYYMQEIKESKILIQIVELSEQMEVEWESYFIAAIYTLLLTIIIVVIFKFQKRVQNEKGDILVENRKG